MRGGPRTRLACLLISAASSAPPGTPLLPWSCVQVSCGRVAVTPSQPTSQRAARCGAAPAQPCGPRRRRAGACASSAPRPTYACWRRSSRTTVRVTAPCLLLPIPPRPPWVSPPPSSGSSRVATKRRRVPVDLHPPGRAMSRRGLPPDHPI